MWNVGLRWKVMERFLEKRWLIRRSYYIRLENTSELERLGCWKERLDNGTLSLRAQVVIAAMAVSVHNHVAAGLGKEIISARMVQWPLPSETKKRASRSRQSPTSWEIGSPSARRHRPMQLRILHDWQWEKAIGAHHLWCRCKWICLLIVSSSIFKLPR